MVYEYVGAFPCKNLRQPCEKQAEYQTVHITMMQMDLLRYRQALKQHFISIKCVLHGVERVSITRSNAVGC